MPDPVAFMSYAQSDDDDGRITRFCESLIIEVIKQTAKGEFRIFQDRNDLKWGEDWKRRIKDSIDATTFLIPIITPSFFASAACRQELEQFIKREEQLNRVDLILPLYYIEVPALEDKVNQPADKLTRAIKDHQWVDWRDQRFRNVDNTSRRRMAKLAVQIRNALDRVGALTEFKEKPKVLGGIMAGVAKHKWALDVDIVIGVVKGTDENYRKAINAIGDPRFATVELTPERAFLADFDNALKKARVGCLLLTNGSKSRLKSLPDGKDRLAAALNMMRERHLHLGRNVAYLILDGVDGDDRSEIESWLPTSWPAENIVAQIDSSIITRTRDVLDALYRLIETRAMAVMDDDEPVGLPYVVFALTHDEVTRMIKAPGEVFERHSGLGAQFVEFQKLLSDAYPEWPDGWYGPRRDDWCPLGPEYKTVQALPEYKTVQALLQAAVEKINETQPGSRERRLLLKSNLHLQRYTVDEYLSDRFGSKRTLVQVLDAGCLVLLDEVALLYPPLGEADAFFNATSTSIVSLSPFDPARLPTRELFGHKSALRVGNLKLRFREMQDPRCELALNSVERIERWLRLVLPELVTSADAPQSQMDLLKRMDRELHQ